MRRSLLLGWVVALATTTSTLAQPVAVVSTPVASSAPAPVVAAVPAPALTVDEQRAFLAKAEVLSWKETSKGVTRPLKMKLSDGALTHSASFQRVDISKRRMETNRGAEMNFRDYFGYNIAAHHLACLVNRCDLVPAAVERRWHGDLGSLVWWVDDVMMDEGERIKNGVEPPQQWRWVKQQYLNRIFTELTGDVDRNQTNILITKDWRVVLIDFSRAFRTHHEPRPALATVQGIDADVLDGLRRLTKASIKQAAGRWLNGREIDAVLARRDGIVAHVERLIAAKGEAQVVYPMAMASR